MCWCRLTSRRASVKRHLLIVVALVLLTLFSHTGRAYSQSDILGQVNFVQKMDAQIPLDLTFRSAADQPVRIGDYFAARPVILVIGYYNCPNLCDMVRQGLVDSLRTLSFDAGKDFNVVAVSIDPAETPKNSTDAENQFIVSYGRDRSEKGIDFLTGSQDSIKQLAQAVGFEYAYDDSIKQFAHPSGIIVLTPQGRISRYFYGIQFAPNDLRLGLVEASANKIGTVVDQVLLRCYHYDPSTGKYNLIILDALQWAGLATVVALAFFIYRLYRRDGQQKVEAVD